MYSLVENQNEYPVTVIFKPPLINEIVAQWLEFCDLKLISEMQIYEFSIQAMYNHRQIYCIFLKRKLLECIIFTRVLQQFHISISVIFENE